MSQALKIIHTADWHLGHQLHGYSRYYEHQQFLNWLLEQMIALEVDVLCVSGDIFDGANPSATSWQQLYQFLATLTRECPGVQVIMTAGNHDSPSKIAAPGTLLRHFDLHFIGQVAKNDAGICELNRLLIPLKRRDGTLQGWALAVPFLRSSDLQLDASVEDPQQRWQQAIQKLYHDLAALAASVRQPQQLLLAMGHAHIRGGAVSELSERQIMLGGQHALPSDVFASECDYVALGHLHLGQQLNVAGQFHYSGSPLPLSLSERRYHHHVQLLQWQQGELSIDALAVPRCCEMLQVPARPVPLNEVLTELKALPPSNQPFEQQPYLEVPVYLEQPQPQLREQVLAAINSKGYRLARIKTSYPASQQQQHSPYNGRDLDELSAREVFELCYQRRYQQAVPEPLLSAFAQVVEEVQQS